MTAGSVDRLVVRTREAFRARAGRECHVAFAPGRVNLIGEHTDYNDGFVLPMALDRGVAIGYRPTRDGRLTAHAVDLGETASAALDALDEESRNGWFAYVAGVADALRGTGTALEGVELVILGDLPRGAGLSSSAALEVATARALVDVAGAAWEPVAAARMCQRVENDFVGVPCGIMDQMASACAAEGSALLLDCRSLAQRTVSIPARVAVVVMDSGVRRRVAGSEYADRRAACERAVAILQRQFPDVRSLRDVTHAQLDAAAAVLDPVSRRRAQHVVDEIERVGAFVAALERGDIVRAGTLIDASHESLRSLYEVSSDALDALVTRAREQPGCLGARMTGAGFGGYAVALVRADSAGRFVEAMQNASEAEAEPRAFVARPSGGARIASPGVW